MKFRFYFLIILLLSVVGCGGNDSQQSSTDLASKSSQETAAVTDANQDYDAFLNPQPIRALSEIGQTDKTPEFIRAEKFEHKYSDGQNHRELTIHFYKNGPNHFHGDYKEWYPNGTLWKQGTYDENKRVGEWKWWSNGGELVKHALYNQSGLPEGEWSYFRDDGSKRRIENYNNGQRHGTTIQYGPEGIQVVEQLNFQDDKLHGIVTRWFPMSDGETEPQKQLESEFLDGLRDGMSTEWHENGQISNQVEFKNGKRNGRTQRWDTEGNLELDLEFLDGEPVESGTSPSDTADTEKAAADTAE